jgi:hypothetical protein
MGLRGEIRPAERVWLVYTYTENALGGNVGQSNHVLANSIAGDKAERWAGAGEEGLAATKHDGAEVESILIDKTKAGFLPGLVRRRQSPQRAVPLARVLPTRGHPR